MNNNEHLDSIKNYQDFRVAFLHSKFWTHNGLLVPGTKVILNEDFINTDNLLRIPEQVLHFKVYWINKGIAGEVCVPGQWNYCYIDGKFYHMVKMHSSGFIEGSDEEWFYYDLIYDDGQNDWMNNTFYLKGTLELTGDPELALEHIHQMSPIIQNVNGFRFLNGVKKTENADYKTELILPKDIPVAMKLKGMSSADKVGINKELEEFHKRGEILPREEKLWIPFMYRCDDNGNGKWSLLQQIRQHAQAGFKVYDVTVQSAVDAGQVQNFRNKLEILMGSNELYLLSSDENRVFSFAKSLNPTKGVKTIDLSGCTDITILDKLTLDPLYTVENKEPKFSIRGFVDKICNRQGGPSDYKEEMVELFEQIVIPKIAPILGFNDDWDTKVFRDVTIEPIKRDMITNDHLGNSFVKNPEGITGADNILIGEKNHKNFIGDNVGEKENGEAREVLYPIPSSIGIDDFFESSIKTDYRKGMSLSIFDRESAENAGQNIHGKKLTFILDYKKLSPTLSLVYGPASHKLTCETDTEGYLDFSKNLNEFKRGILLLPDYDRKTHVLATNGNTTLGEGGDLFNPSIKCSNLPTNFYYDPKDPSLAARTKHQKNGQTCSLYIEPIIFDEIIDVKEKLIPLDWEKPTDDILREYLNLGKDYTHPSDEKRWEERGRQSTFRAWGAEWLSKGVAFRMLTTTDGDVFNNRDKNRLGYDIKHKTYSAKCFQGGCDYEYGSGQEHTIYTAIKSMATLPECVYEGDNNEGRRFHTEFTFPVKTDEFSIIDILREFDDLPDNFLRGEVINSGVKKGHIAKTVRTIERTSSQRLNASRIKPEQEKQIPKNTVVSIGLCLRPSGSPQNARDLDTKAIGEWSRKNKPGSSIHGRIYDLIQKLHQCFFLTKGESGSNIGAIPVRLRNESKVNASIYPKTGDRSQLSLSWAKPHRGGGYVAGTRFVFPNIDDVRGRFNKESGGYLDYNYQGTKDGVIAVIPEKYADSNEWAPRFTYRRKATSTIDGNVLLGLLTQTFFIQSEAASVKIPNVNMNNYYSFSGSNTRTAEGGKNADYLNDRFRKYFYNWETLTLNDFFDKAKTYKTKRTDNPTKIPEAWKRLQATAISSGNPIEHSPFDNEVPPFVIPYLDPESRVCTLHGWERNNEIRTKNDRIQLYKDKLNQLARSTMISLESWNEGIKFEGTNWYASIKLNTKNNTIKWDYELFTDEIGSFLGTETEKWNFINHKEKDVDVLINTRNELSIYGNKFPLKSRKFSEEKELDIGLHVKALDDVKQTEAAAWYSVQMNLNDQDILQTFIETPKELVKYQGFSAYEREKLIREIGLRGEEYLYNMQMIEYQKEENKFTNQYEKDWIYKEWKYDVARGATQIIGGALDVVTGGAGTLVASAGIQMADHIQGQMGSRVHDKTRPLEIPYRSKYAQVRDSFNRPGTEQGNTYGGPSHPYYTAVGGSPNAYQNRRMAHYGLTQARAAAGGAMGIVGGALTIAEAYETFNIKDEYRKQKYAMAEKKLSAEGDILNKRHEFERKNLLDDLWAMSANVHYPQLNANIVYKLYNKHIGIGDIHMVQYYPKGKLLDYIKEYYKEFGYNIMVRNFECTGIQNIKNHLRYQFIYEINHPNINIQEMIRSRALAGIKVIPWTQ